MVWGYASVGGKKARGASFFAAPKKEGKKRAFFKRIWLTAFGRGPVTITTAMTFMYTFLETRSIAVKQGFSGCVDPIREALDTLISGHIVDYKRVGFKDRT